MEDIKPVSPVGAIIFVVWLIVFSGLAVTRLFLYPVACDMNRRIHARIEPFGLEDLRIFFFLFLWYFLWKMCFFGRFSYTVYVFSSSPFRLNNSYFLSVPNAICFINDNSCQEKFNVFWIANHLPSSNNKSLVAGVVFMGKNYVVVEMTALRWASFIGQNQTNFQLAFVVR